MTKNMSVASSLILCALLLAACVPRSTATASSQPSAKTSSVLLSGLGTSCQNNGLISPPSYSVRDIGKPSVPSLSKSDVVMLHKIERYVHSPTLRFAYASGKFIIFDAKFGPCSGTPYSVLNASWCNMLYVPYDANGKEFSGGACFAHPRPWISHDGGNPKALPWR